MNVGRLGQDFPGILSTVRYLSFSCRRMSAQQADTSNRPKLTKLTRGKHGHDHCLEPYRCDCRAMQVAQLDERMQQLEEERAELVRWQGLDKQRRGLQYAIHDADLAEASEKLAQVPVLVHLDVEKVHPQIKARPSPCIVAWHADAALPCRCGQQQGLWCAGSAGCWFSRHLRHSGCRRSTARIRCQAGLGSLRGCSPQPAALCTGRPQDFTPDTGLLTSFMTSHAVMQT